MTGYYTFDVAELQKERTNSNKQPFPHQQEAFSALSKTLSYIAKLHGGAFYVFTIKINLFTSRTYRNVLKALNAVWFFVEIAGTHSILRQPHHALWEQNL